MTSFGEDIIISVGGTDYSVYIDTYSESGGDKQIQHIRTFGNNYETVTLGVNDYELNLQFRVESNNVKTIFENVTPVTIIITVGSDSTITYKNMLPKNLTYNLETEDIAVGEITFTTSAFTSGTSNRVLS